MLTDIADTTPAADAGSSAGDVFNILFGLVGNVFTIVNHAGNVS